MVVRFKMKEVENIARVILRPDGLVHIAFRDIRSIYATPENMVQLFSNPFGFIKSESYTYKESTSELNRKRVPLDEILGLTLATITTDKQIVCDFPELFQYIFTSFKNEDENNAKDKTLNMSFIELETIFPDEKSYLLRYYLEFTNHLTTKLIIKNNIELRDKIQTEIMREMLNTFFAENLPQTKTLPDMSEKIAQCENTLTFKNDEASKHMISVTEYSELWQIPRVSLARYIREGRFKSAMKQPNGHYLIDKSEKPTELNLRKGKRRRSAPEDNGKYYKRKSTGSAEDVRQHIIKLDLFSEHIAQYIHTYEELDYYQKRRYHEVCWDGQRALIIDINPDYITKAGKQNRDLIKEGKAPHIPDREKDEYVYHIHHIGQHPNSPFAIIPEYDHNGANYSSVFHQVTPKENLHTREFEIQKEIFWKTYLEKYDEAGSFSKIEYTNHYANRNKK